MLTPSTNKSKKVSSEAGNLSKRIRDITGWSQQEMADRLMISRNYVSLVEGGKKEASVRLLHALHVLASEVEKDSIRPAHKSGAIGTDDKATAGSSASLVAKFERHNDELLEAAGKDVGRLCWIIEQQKAHLAIPAHWSRSMSSRLVTINPKSATSQPLPSSLPRSHSA